MKKKNKKKEKLVIIGCADSYIEDRIYDNKDEYEIWGVASCLMKEKIRRIDKVFEIHRKDEYFLDTWQVLYDTELPVYMWEKDENVKNRVDFPIENIRNIYGEYICSSFSLMLLYAYEQGYNNIYFRLVDYGINGTIRERNVERCNLEYWIGYLRGKGIRIDVRNTSLLENIYYYGLDDICKGMNYWQEKYSQLYLEIISRFRNEMDGIRLLQRLETIKDMISYM